MPLLFGCREQMAYEDYERRQRREVAAFVVIFALVAAAVMADRFFGLGIGVDRVVAPLVSI